MGILLAFKWAHTAAWWGSLCGSMPYTAFGEAARGAGRTGSVWTGSVSPFALTVTPDGDDAASEGDEAEGEDGGRGTQLIPSPALSGTNCDGASFGAPIPLGGVSAPASSPRVGSYVVGFHVGSLTGLATGLGVGRGVGSGRQSGSGPHVALWAQLHWSKLESKMRSPRHAKVWETAPPLHWANSPQSVPGIWTKPALWLRQGLQFWARREAAAEADANR